MTGGGMVHGEVICPYCWNVAYQHVKNMGKKCPKDMTFKDFVLKGRTFAPKLQVEN